MTKPIVALLPEIERERLRTSGALPVDFFSADNPNGVSLWPYDIDYSHGPEIAAAIRDRPGDVSVFFGCPEPKTGSEANRNAAAIVKVLHSVMVHIVFLDDESEKGALKYGHFRSFTDIINWSTSLLEVVRVRFTNEVQLHKLENVLVVVARGQQIRLTEEERVAFSDIVGKSSKDSVKPFVSCYFLNHELSIDSTRDVIFAENVWDILVSRLLKAFVLSRDRNPTAANSSPPIWMKPGVKIWKAEECEAKGLETICHRELERVLSSAESIIRDDISSDSRDKTVLTDADVKISVSGIVGEELLSPPGKTWSSPAFDPVRFVASVADSETRRKQVEGAARAYSAWRRKTTVSDTAESKSVFNSVKGGTNDLYARLAELDRALNHDGARASLSSGFREEIRKIAELEAQRRRILDMLSHEPGARGENDPGGMAQELRRTQRHYVGFGVSMCVSAAVIAMCGWLFWQAVRLLDGSPTCALVLISLSAFGSFAAAALTVALHYQAGYQGAEAFTKTCRDLDIVSARRDDAVRDLFCSAARNRAIALRRNSRLRTRDLLVPIRDVLVRELKYSPAVADEFQARCLPQFDKFTKEQRKTYLANTVSMVEFPAAKASMYDVNTIVDVWWRSDHHFRELWTDFCNRFDTANSGHFPVSSFIPKMRMFMDAFVKATRWDVRNVIMDSCPEIKRKGLVDWFARTENIRFYSGKAAPNARAAVPRRLVFLAKDSDPLYRQELDNANTSLGAEIVESRALAEISASSMALSYHEMNVWLERDARLGVLSLRQADGEEMA